MKPYRQINLKIILLVYSICLSACSSTQKKVEWVSSTEQSQWLNEEDLQTIAVSGKVDAEIFIGKPMQTMEGFGACFNELGWTSLNTLSQEDRESILNEMFSPGVGANFTICRMPVGANDFARDWYSYDETEGRIL